VISKREDAKNARIQLVIPKDVLARVRDRAGKERRNTSNMIVVLLDEAFAARESQESSGLDGKPGPKLPTPAAA
jgi:hypothetical protein